MKPESGTFPSFPAGPHPYSYPIATCKRENEKRKRKEYRNQQKAKQCGRRRNFYFTNIPSLTSYYSIPRLFILLLFWNTSERYFFKIKNRKKSQNKKITVIEKKRIERPENVNVYEGSESKRRDVVDQ